MKPPTGWPLLLRFQEANANAQNALLKTLEEAPRKVVLLVTADSPESLFCPPSPRAARCCACARWALERLDCRTDASAACPKRRLAPWLISPAGGWALPCGCATTPTLLDARRAWGQDMFKLLADPRRARLAMPKGWPKTRSACASPLQSWLSLWRDAMLSAADPYLPLTNLEHETELRRLGGAVGVSAARARIADLEQGLARLDANVNPRLLAEVLLLDWPRIS